jgi:hypothetical protein
MFPGTGDGSLAPVDFIEDHVGGKIPIRCALVVKEQDL